MFICKECNKECKNLNSLSSHIRRTHKNLKEYFDKWILKEGDRYCKLCGKENKFFGISYGYTNGCKQHMHILGYEKRKNSLLKLYNVENQFQRPEIKDKNKETWIKKYGVDNPNKSRKVREKIENTNFILYDASCSFGNNLIREKCAKTCEKNYGVRNPFSSEIVKKFIKKTLFERYGVENPLQNRDILDKAFKTRILIKNFKDTKLTYQGSYEYDFLEKFIEIYPDIMNGLSFNYILQNKSHTYHSDFYIPSLNLIIEIKNFYHLKKYKEEIELKGLAVKLYGFNYILIVDKHYKTFKNYVERIKTNK